MWSLYYVIYICMSRHMYVQKQLKNQNNFVDFHFQVPNWAFHRHAARLLSLHQIFASKGHTCRHTSHCGPFKWRNSTFWNIAQSVEMRFVTKENGKNQCEKEDAYTIPRLFPIRLFFFCLLAMYLCRYFQRKFVVWCELHIKIEAIHPSSMYAVNSLWTLRKQNVTVWKK